MHDNLFYLKPIISALHNVEQVDSYKRKVSSSNDTYLWHLHLGYISHKCIQRLVKDGPLGLLELEELPPCESCLKGKLTK